MTQFDRDRWIILTISSSNAYLRGAAIPLAVWALVERSLLLGLLCGFCLIASRIARGHGQQFEFRRIK